MSAKTANVLTLPTEQVWSGELLTKPNYKTMNEMTLDDELGLLWYEYTQTGSEEKLAEYERLRKFQKSWKENVRIF